MSTVAELRARLRTRFPQQAWALFWEVRDGTGFITAGRTADAIAMGLWPSRGLEVHGFELKLTRHDWQRELSKPEKAEAIQGYCDRWWVVAPDGVVADGELPRTWGLLEAPARGLKCRREAPTLEAKPLDRIFVASLARAMQRKSVDLFDQQFRAANTWTKDQTFASVLSQIKALHIQRVEQKIQARAFQDAIKALGVV